MLHTHSLICHGFYIISVIYDLLNDVKNTNIMPFIAVTSFNSRHARTCFSLKFAASGNRCSVLISCAQNDARFHFKKTQWITRHVESLAAARPCTFPADSRWGPESESTYTQAWWSVTYWGSTGWSTANHFHLRPSIQHRYDCVWLCSYCYLPRRLPRRKWHCVVW
jgi:hypothetical protein